jgi:hypothetical protein
MVFLVLLLIPFVLLISSTQKNSEKENGINDVQPSKAAG